MISTQTKDAKAANPTYTIPCVARVVAGELGLDTTSIVCALLHDTVEDTNLTIDEVETIFGVKVRNIVDGLTKMSGVFEPGKVLK